MSVIDNDYIVLYYYSKRGVYTTEQTTGWRLRTLSVLLGSLFAAGMAMVPGRLNGQQSSWALSTRTFSSLRRVDEWWGFIFRDLNGSLLSGKNRRVSDAYFQFC
jgi:hypothetical protein